ncbi:MAG: right-handed parallel beta-helix repeat-containing protein [bacterium]
MKVKLVGLLVVAIMAISFFAEAKIIRVPVDYLTIQEGIDAAVSGDQVVVAAGTYEENIVLKSGVDVLGAGADVTKITSKLKIIYAEFVTSGVIDGFTIDAKGVDVESIFCAFSTLTISNNIITNQGVGVGILCTDWANLTITNNIITKQRVGIECSPANPIIQGNTIIGNSTGVHCYDYASPTIDNNSIIDNGDYGIFCEGSESSLVISGNNITGNGQGVRCRLTSPNIYDNVIIDNGDGIRCVDSSNPAIKNNIISDNGRAGVACDGSAPWASSPAIRNNIISNNGHYGVSCSGDSSPDLGNGYNAIYGSGDYDIENTTQYTVIAEYNWWGQAPPFPSQFYGKVDYDPWLEESPFPTTGSIIGIVTDTAGNPIKSAIVIAILGETKQKAFTDSDGWYEILDLEPGIYWVLCIKKDYKAGIKKAEVIAGQKTEVNFKLKK